jgi:hypothetical protein
MSGITTMPPLQCHGDELVTFATDERFVVLTSANGLSFQDYA